MYDILELKEEAMTVRVEPMVTVGDITRYLIPKGKIGPCALEFLFFVFPSVFYMTFYITFFVGYTLAVTLEIADATLGGLAFGVGMTTYSHKVQIILLAKTFKILSFW